MKDKKSDNTRSKGEKNTASHKLGKQAVQGQALQELQQQIDSLTEALQRERADAVNLRRQYEERMGAVKSTAVANVVRNLLPFIDNFERALKHAPITQASHEKNGPWEDWLKGLQSVQKQLAKSLENMGIERIKTVGELFNPRYHEAIAVEEGDGTQEIVTEELQAGYKVNDDIIRHAMVKVKMS